MQFLQVNDIIIIKNIFRKDFGGAIGFPKSVTRMSRTVIGIDVGGTTTKIVGFRKHEYGKPELISPQFVRATDPLTSIYGAFGKFTAENGLELEDIDRILMTGAGCSVIKKSIYNCECIPVPEFSSSGIGGLYLSGLSEAIVVSMGTGTALNHAKKTGNKFDIKYLGGTGVGGGTLVGLSRKLTGVDTVEHIERLCAEGNLDNVDLRIKDISQNHTYNGINENLRRQTLARSRIWQVLRIWHWALQIWLPKPLLCSQFLRHAAIRSKILS